MHTSASILYSSFFLMLPSGQSLICHLIIPLLILGNNQKKANALIEASGLKMIGMDDFNKAAKTVS